MTTLIGPAAVAAPEVAPTSTNREGWERIVARYQGADHRRSAWQLINSFAPYLALTGVMFWFATHSWWLPLLLVPITAGLLIRIYIIFHDCGHHSFLRSRRANNVVGIICGFLVFTPYYRWRHLHAVHHATSGDLDRRGTGDIDTLSVREYVALPRMQKVRYRVYRNPFVMFGLGTVFTQVLGHRIPRKSTKPVQRNNMLVTDAVLVGVALTLCLVFGWKAYLLVQGATLLTAGAAGIWLFYVQHQFEDAYWQPHQQWNFADAALEGSSYLKLPKVMQWFTGNIGLHHVHHLSSRIPNYRLQRCHDENPLFHNVHTLTLWSALKAVQLKLWDEESGKLVSFRHLRTRTA